MRQGSLPVPNHLRSAGDRRMKAHGIGVGYGYPHDFEGADVEQQYLPDELVGRRYYVPNDQGYEATIAARMAAREEARQDKPRKKRRPEPADGRDVAMPCGRARRTARKIAETEKKDASG